MLPPTVDPEEAVVTASRQVAEVVVVGDAATDAEGAGEAADGEASGDSAPEASDGDEG